jgi:polar amino acid transport system substrate-binding protein
MRLLLAAGLAMGIAGAAQAKDWKVVRIGVDATYPPFESVDPSGKIVGWEIEYGNALCAKMGVTCVWQNQDWDGIIPALLSGKFDVIVSSMNETPARAKRVMFSNVYYATPPVWVTQASTKSDDTSPAFMKGKTIGVQSSTVFAAFLEKDYKDADMKTYPGGDEPLTDLANGRLDYAINDILVAQKVISKNPGCCRIIKEIPRDPTVFGPGVGAAFRPDDVDLKNMFNKAIAEVKADGTFKKLADKYFTINIEPASDKPVTSEPSG